MKEIVLTVIVAVLLWYIYYSAGSEENDLSTRRSFVLENDSDDLNLGEWNEKGKLAIPPEDIFAIDATVLEYKEQLFLIWSGIPSADDFTQNLYIARMENPYTLVQERVVLSVPESAWEREGEPKVNEGPVILKNSDEDIFLVYSGSFCGTDHYQLGMPKLRTGGNPMNSGYWEKSESPVFSPKPEHKQYATGHNSFFTSPDGSEDWIICHANSHPDQGCTETRSPRMQKIEWNKDGTPDFGEPVRIGIPVEVTSGEQV